ncbi:MAG: hypothetical protein PHU12_02680 [Candidatus Aenigmarchaeota archaeon]|nr:hypothetical protein [Candidatus Aenigmarchaeota archaeon]
MTETVTLREVIDYFKEFPNKKDDVWWDVRHLQDYPEGVREMYSPRDKAYSRKLEALESEKQEVAFKYLNTIIKDDFSKSRFETEIDPYFWQEPRPSGNEIYTETFDILVKIAKKGGESREEAIHKLAELVTSRIDECIAADDVRMDMRVLEYEYYPFHTLKFANDKEREEYEKRRDEAVKAMNDNILRAIKNYPKSSYGKKRYDEPSDDLPKDWR